MRLLGILLALLGSLMLADWLLSGLVRPMLDPGVAPSLGGPPAQLVPPAVTLAVGLLLLRQSGRPKGR